MTLETRLSAATDELRQRTSDLVPPDLPGRREGFPYAWIAVGLGVLLASFILWPSPISEQSLASDTSRDTYTDEFGRVWYATDCPSADVLLVGSADGLPMKGHTSFERVQSYVGDGGRASVVPRNGQVWERLGDGSISVTHVDDYMIEVTINDESECPQMPISNNGIPVAFRLVGD
ncbi:MAG: hypothetical protein ACR2NT_14650 [Acidimicrobiia bacterium]